MTAIKLEDLNVTAEDGAAVTGADVESWEDAYAHGRLPDGYARGSVRPGRPRLSADVTETLTIRLAKGEKEQIKREAGELGMTASAYVREILAMRHSA